MGDSLKKTNRLPVLAGGAALAAVLLSGCGSEAATFEGRNVEDLDKTIESVDAMWAQNRAEGTKSNVDDESRCYAQVTDLAMSEDIICGPIHYLGSDDQVWESVALSFMPDGDKKAVASVDGSFSTAKRAENTTLFRPDGKESPEDLVVPEPDTETAAPEQAIWESGAPQEYGTNTVAVRLPGGSTMNVIGWKVSERVGSAENRLKAGEGRTFASVYFPDSLSNQGAPTELAFVSGGKSYPLGAPKSGTVSMSLPGDAKDAELAVTTDGNTQTVSLTTGEITSTASAYYDGLARTPEETVLIEQETDNGAGQTASFRMDDHNTFREAYEPKQGWAPEGKAWLIVDAQWYTTLKNSGGFMDQYEHETKVTSATVEGLSGEKYTAEAVRIDNTKVPDSYRNADKTKIVFEVPAGVGDFKVTLNVNSAGSQHEDGFFSKSAPQSVSIDDTISYEAIFPRSSY